MIHKELPMSNWHREFCTSMRSQDTTGDAPRFEQAVAQQHRITDGAPYRPYGVTPHGDTLNEHRIDRHAY